MARRISWTNNSSGHSGTYVYRAPTLDPQSLPEPIATADPVAHGVTAEWIDNDALDPGDYDYAVQDFDGSGVSTISALTTFTVSDYLSGAQVGDYAGGGVYAGILEINGTNYHIIFSKQDGEKAPPVAWKNSQTATPGADDDYDGLENTNNIVIAGISDHPAAEHCVNYAGGGFSDWYLPARYELAMESGLREHPELSVERSAYRWASEYIPESAITINFNGSLVGNTKTTDNMRVRPIRRVPV